MKNIFLFGILFITLSAEASTEWLNKANVKGATITNVSDISDSEFELCNFRALILKQDNTIKAILYPNRVSFGSNGNRAISFIKLAYKEKAYTVQFSIKGKKVTAIDDEPDGSFGESGFSLQVQCL